MDEKAAGTLISNKGSRGEIRAIAAKDGITAIRIKSSRMLLAYGFLRKVFDVFEKYRTPIDMITTSEIAVSVTIDDPKNLSQIIAELDKLGVIETENELSIVCIVGNMIAQQQGLLNKVFRALSDIQVQMVSFGGSQNNISLLVRTSDKNLTLEKLNEGLFNLY